MSSLVIPLTDTGHGLGCVCVCVWQTASHLPRKGEGELPSGGGRQRRPRGEKGRDSPTRCTSPCGMVWSILVCTSAPICPPLDLLTLLSSISACTRLLRHSLVPQLSSRAVECLRCCSVQSLDLATVLQPRHCRTSPLPFWPSHHRTLMLPMLSGASIDRPCLR